MEKFDFLSRFLLSLERNETLPNSKNLPIDVLSINVMEQLIETVTADWIQISSIIVVFVFLMTIHLDVSMAIIFYASCSEKPLLTTQHLRTQEDHDSDIIVATSSSHLEVIREPLNSLDDCQILIVCII